uniref:NADH-ubiquinone oxidoreductase chain 3 n=1 Tax=Nepiomorpha sp. NespEL TaxID=1940904 RepID=A0A8K1ZG34_9NEOP|nr:NADH dehydrogenase subunit 3 [Nepiomorpha sp. NespEL]
MMNIMLIFIITFLISNGLMSICMMISKKSLLDREKNSPFECGFDQKSSSRLPFSLQFFMIAIIFLIFDVEITLILPSITMPSFSSFCSWLILNSTFILVLLLGIIHEWIQGALEWSK